MFSTKIAIRHKSTFLSHKDSKLIKCFFNVSLPFCDFIIIFLHYRFINQIIQRHGTESCVMIDCGSITFYCFRFDVSFLKNCSKYMIILNTFYEINLFSSIAKSTYLTAEKYKTQLNYSK